MSLTSVASIGLSGMNAAALHQYAASNNISNTLTDKYKPIEVSQTALPSGGVATKLSQGNPQASDLVNNVIAQIGAVYSFKANLITIRVADEMIGTTLNVLA